MHEQWWNVECSLSWIVPCIQELTSVRSQKNTAFYVIDRLQDSSSSTGMGYQSCRYLTCFWPMFQLTIGYTKYLSSIFGLIFLITHVHYMCKSSLAALPVSGWKRHGQLLLVFRLNWLNGSNWLNWLRNECVVNGVSAYLLSSLECSMKCVTIHKKQSESLVWFFLNCIYSFVYTFIVLFSYYIFWGNMQNYQVCIQWIPLEFEQLVIKHLKILCFLNMWLNSIYNLKGVRLLLKFRYYCCCFMYIELFTLEMLSCLCVYENLSFGWMCVYEIFGRMECMICYARCMLVWS